MSGSPGPGGPPGGGSGEAAFRHNLRNTVSAWQHRLRIPQAIAHEGSAIGREAGELRVIAQSRGWGVIAQQLQNIERLSRESPNKMVDALGTLARILAPSNDPAVVAVPDFQGTFRMDPARGVGAGVQKPGSVPAPPLLNQSGPRPWANAPPAHVVLPHVVPPHAALPPPISIGPTPPTPQPQSAPVTGATLASAKDRISSQAPSAPPPAPRGALPDSRHEKAVPLPDSVEKPAVAPKLLVRSMFGFRAFGKEGPPAQSASSPPGGPGAPPPARGSLLGFAKISSRPSQAPPRATPPRGGSAPPPGRASFLAGREDSRPRQRSSHPDPAGWRGQRPSRPSADRISRNAGGAVPRWLYFVVGVIGVLAISTVIVVVVNTRRGAAEAVPASDAALALPSVKDASRAAVADPMVEAVHGQGQETAELGALIDQQSRMIASCRIDASKCDKWARDALLLGSIDAGSFLPAQENGQPLSAWLQRLKLPRDFPVKDDPALSAFFGYSAKHPTGRASFQLKLFRCSKYEDIFDMTLVKYGAPSWLRAVVFQESGCDPLAGSPVGARGLWQFMAESARAYGLLVNEKGDVDERLSPVKSTDAAIHFLTDLHTNLGSWDLALAGYNMGPYGLIMRIAQLGGHAGFWDMRRSDLLPAETADYVPAIEAFALILENRRSLGFPIDVPLPESTAELNAKPGTRLSLIARVARTSTSKIQEFNLDFLGPVVPSGETSVRVPLASEQVLQVQEALDNWPPDDTRDTCVPPDYVWGSGDFETSPYAKKCTR